MMSPLYTVVDVHAAAGLPCTWHRPQNTLQNPNTHTHHLHMHHTCLTHYLACTLSPVPICICIDGFLNTCVQDTEDHGHGWCEGPGDASVAGRGSLGEVFLSLVTVWSSRATSWLGLGLSSWPHSSVGPAASSHCPQWAWLLLCPLCILTAAVC